MNAMNARDAPSRARVNGMFLVLARFIVLPTRYPQA